MNIKVLNKDKDSVELLITGEETILNPLKKLLVLDETVSFVGFNRKHPAFDEINFVVKGKNAELSLKKAVKQFESELKDFLTQAF